MLEQPSVVLCWIIRRQLGARGWIEHIVDYLRAVEDPCTDHSIERRRVADSGKAEKANLALPPQPLKCGHDLTKDLLDAEGFAPTGLGNRIVKMEDVDPVTPQSY